MKKTKAEKGITLIALIITIIVLLILAMVTIRAVQEHGIIGYAKQAQTEYDKKAEEENSTLQGYATHLKEQTFKWKLDESGETVTRDNVTLNIGDYVDYTPDGDATYPTTKLTEAITGSSSNTTDIERDDLKWRVFGVDSNGYLTLISDQETSQLVYLEDAAGYNNGVYVLNDICEKLYSNTTKGIKARSLTIEDVEGGFREPGKDNRNKYTSNGGILYGKNNSSSPYTNGKNQYPILYEQEKGSGTTGVIQKDGIGVSNPYYTEEQLTTKGEEKATASGSLACTQTYYYLSKSAGDFKSSKFYEMLFPSSGDYWLASRFVDCSSTYADFGLRCMSNSYIYGRPLFGSDGYSSDRKATLRPAVSLGPDIIVKPCTGPNSPENMHTLEKAS